MKTCRILHALVPTSSAQHSCAGCASLHLPRSQCDSCHQILAPGFKSCLMPTQLKCRQCSCRKCLHQHTKRCTEMQAAMTVHACWHTAATSREIFDHQSFLSSSTHWHSRCSEAYQSEALSVHAALKSNTTARYSVCHLLQGAALHMWSLPIKHLAGKDMHCNSATCRTT